MDWLISEAETLVSGTISESAATTLSSVGTFTLTAATAGTYNVSLWGAEGGGASSGPYGSFAGGLGSEIDGTIQLSAGEELVAVIGANGASSSLGGAGGDATILYEVIGDATTILAVAGGGGGAGEVSVGDNAPAIIADTSAYPGDNGGGFRVAGGTNGGNGGTALIHNNSGSSGSSVTYYGRGGYGVLSNNGTIGGIAGGAGGGFGSAGEGYGGGGGGGYSGGGGGGFASYGGGGSSYFSASGETLITSAPAAAPNNASGGEITFSPLCFLAGTLIETAGGAVSVEQVRVGDLVRTSTGVEKPVTWVGQARIMVPARRRDCGAPVIIRAGAFGNGVPFADLHVTAGHSFLFDNVLIPAEFLVNHRSIVWDDRAQEIEIFHIELEDHAVLIANGAPAESYRDDGNRWLFHNHNPGWDVAEKPVCAPVLTGGPVVDKVWRRLLDLCGAGEAVELTDDPDLHLVADGVRVEARRIGRDVYAFDLQNACEELVIASRAAAQDELGLVRDPRMLGVAVRRIVLWGDSWPVVLDADHADLREGFHRFEAGEEAIWTNGRGVIPLPDVRVRRVQVELAGRTRYRAGALAARRVA